VKIAVLAALIVSAIDLSSSAQVFRAGVEIVAVDVSVTRGGAPVAGLSAKDFVLTDNGVVQDVESASVDALPLSVTMVLDTSSSVAGDRLAHLVQAGADAAAALRPADRAALVTFSHQINMRVAMTGDMNTIRTALSRLRADGATSLRDAVHLAFEVQPHDSSRPLILVFTDGRDSASWLTEDGALETARRAGVVVHVVGFGTDSFLSRLADTTGGRLWSATSDRQLRELFTRALDEMRARYVLTYTPNHSAPGWHELRVKLKNQRADITARRGYFVAEKPSGSSRPQ
jgi:VWFA-related protein